MTILSAAHYTTISTPYIFHFVDRFNKKESSLKFLHKQDLILATKLNLY